MSELKPCPSPWCNSTDIEMSHHSSQSKFFMKCMTCNLEGPYSTKEDAIEAWNTRAPDKEQAWDWFKAAATHYGSQVVGGINEDALQTYFDKRWQDKHGVEE